MTCTWAFAHEKYTLLTTRFYFHHVTSNLCLRHCLSHAEGLKHNAWKSWGHFLYWNAMLSPLRIKTLICVLQPDKPFEPPLKLLKYHTAHTPILIRIEPHYLAYTFHSIPDLGLEMYSFIYRWCVMSTQKCILIQLLWWDSKMKGVSLIIGYRHTTHTHRRVCVCCAWSECACPQVLFSAPL